MNAEVIMSAMAGCAAFAGALASVVALSQKQQAEREFLNVLANETAAARLRVLWRKIMEDGAVSSSELQSLIGSLEKLTDELPREHKLLIEYGLRQKIDAGSCAICGQVDEQSRNRLGVLACRYALMGSLVAAAR